MDPNFSLWHQRGQRSSEEWIRLLEHKIDMLSANEGLMKRKIQTLEYELHRSWCYRIKKFFREVYSRETN